MDSEWRTESYENKKGTWTNYPELCKGCGLCIEKCPTKVIAWSEVLGFMGTPSVKVKVDGCIVCGICSTVCPDCAIAVRRHDGKKPAAAL